MARRLTSPELVGRSVELDTLLEALARAGRGEPTIVSIAGEAGIGKTRLVEAFGRSVPDGAARMLRGGCVELGDAGVAFAPIVEALRSLMAEIGAAGLIDVAGHPCRAIARLIPDLPGPAADGGDWGPDQGDLFEELFTLLRRLGTERPLVLVLEDLHWADRSTRELVRFLTRNLRSERILLLLTFRHDDLHRRHPLVPLVAELDRLPLAERITLHPMSRDEVATLTGGILGSTPLAAQVDSLFERSDGNPFYVEELVAHEDAGAVPTPVREIVTARAAGLSDESQAVLRVAALVGRRPQHAMLAGLSGLGPQRLTDVLREAVDAAFLVPREDDRYAFRHELVREALYDDLLPAERTELHGRLAALIEASENASDAEAAFHWGLAHETGRALAASVRAARTALETLAFGEALALLLRALELWPGVPNAPEIAGIARTELLERAADAAASAGDNREAIRLGRTAAVEVDAVLEPDRWLALADRLAWYEWDDGSAALAERTLRDALVRTPGASPRTTATILASLAELKWSACEYDAMRDLAAQAVELSALDGDIAARCRALALHGASLGQLGDIDAALAELRQAHALSLEGPASLEEVVLTHMTQVLVLAGRHAETLAVAAPTVSRGLERGTFRRYEVFLLTNYIDSLDAAGALDQVKLILEDPARPRRGWRATTWLLGAQMDLCLRRGETVAAEVAMREYRARTPASASVSDRLWLGRGDLLLALADRDPDRACAVAWAVIDRAPDPRRDLILGRWLLPLAMTAHADRAERMRASGDEDAVARARDEGERLASLVLGDGSHAPALMHPAHRAMCSAEHSRIRGVSDAGRWREAAEALDGVPEAGDAAYAWFRAGEASLLARDRPNAVVSLRTSREAAIRLGAAPLLGRIDDLARRARLTEELETGGPGVDATDAPGEPTPGFRLSRRELEVLALVAEGLTNREIGEALFITPKTASVHVTHILDKLGVSSRVEAALLAAQSGMWSPR
jgi:DNA-binding CsgD family transcriptional regulator